MLITLSYHKKVCFTQSTLSENPVYRIVCFDANLVERALLNRNRAYEQPCKNLRAVYNIF